MPKIFQPRTLPPKLFNKAHWDYTQGWAIEIGGHTLYGFKSKEDIEAALTHQPIRPFYKQ